MARVICSRASRAKNNKQNRPQRPQGGIFIGPKGQQSGQGSQQNRNAAGQQQSRFENQNRGSQQGGKQQFNKKRSEKPQIKGQYASRDSRNMQQPRPYDEKTARAAANRSSLLYRHRL